MYFGTIVDAGTRWGLAEGRTGGPLHYSTYILMANPESTAAEVTVTFLRETGGPIIVERAMYWDPSGVAFVGGTNATGIRLATP